MTVSAERLAYFESVKSGILEARYLELLKEEGALLSTNFKAGAFAGYRPAASDIIVTTYPKSGTNWTMQMAQEIAWYGAAEFDYIHDVIPWPDSVMRTPVVSLSDRKMADSAPTGLRVIKSHLEAEFIPFEPAAKYIIVIRDPKEVVVSASHFQNGFFARMVGETVPLAAYVEGFLTGNFMHGSWAAHTAGWWALRHSPNVCLLFYHEMKADSDWAIGQIAAFLGIELTSAQFAKVVEKSSYRYMKAHNDKFSPPAPSDYPDQGKITMVRAGQAGQANEALTVEQQTAIDRFCIAQLAEFQSDFPYQEIYAR